MKKILMGILIILLLVLGYFAMFNGISIGNFKILSIKQITEENDKLEEEIAVTERLMKSDFPTKTDELDKSISDLLVAKDEYLDLASVSTGADLTKANQEEIYKQEYLWVRLDTHARQQGVNLKFELVRGDTGEADVYNINFTVTGAYQGIINFTTALEDDSRLAFRIENFKLIPGGSEIDLQATFTTKNVKVKLETLTNTIQPNTTEQSTNNNQNTTTQTNSTLNGVSASDKASGVIMTENNTQGTQPGLDTAQNLLP